MDLQSEALQTALANTAPRTKLKREVKTTAIPVKCICTKSMVGDMPPVKSVPFALFIYHCCLFCTCT